MIIFENPWKKTFEKITVFDCKEHREIRAFVEYHKELRGASDRNLHVQEEGLARFPK